MVLLGYILGFLCFIGVIMWIVYWANEGTEPSRLSSVELQNQLNQIRDRQSQPVPNSSTERTYHEIINEQIQRDIRDNTKK